MKSSGRLAYLLLVTTIAGALAGCLPGVPTIIPPLAPTQVATQNTPTPAPPPAPATPAALAPDTLAADLQAGLPPDAFDGVHVLPLDPPPGQRPAWAAFTYGLRNFRLDPVPDHFLAIFVQDKGAWREVARLTLSGDNTKVAAPDYLGKGSVTQVRIDPSRVWLAIDGGAGAHGGVFDLLSFDGSQLRRELNAAAPSPGVGRIQDLNGDGRPEVIINASDPYVFCYACGVAKIAYVVHAWNEDQRQFLKMPLQEMLMGQSGHPGRAANNDGVMYGQAGLWRDAMARISEAKQLSTNIRPPFTNELINWNYGIIKLHADVMAQHAQESGYPLLTTVFYGDYPAAVNLMRKYTAEQIFSVDTPLIVDTVADTWIPSLTHEITTSASAAIQVMPNLAGAYFLRGWAEFVADPVKGLARARADVAKAAALVPADPLYKLAAAYLAKPVTPRAQPPSPRPPTPTPKPGTPQSAQARRIQFAAGATSAEAKGQVGPGTIDEYVVRARQGQQMMVSLLASRNDIFLAVTGLSDGRPYLRSAAGATTWQGLLPATQDYSLKIVPSSAAGTYTLQVVIPARITFKPGATGASVEGRLGANDQHEYVLKALKNQKMTVAITSPRSDVVVEIYGFDDGQPLVRVPMGANHWSGVLPGTQDYSIKAVAVGGAANYTMTITVK